RRCRRKVVSPADPARGCAGDATGSGVEPATRLRADAASSRDMPLPIAAAGGRTTACTAVHKPTGRGCGSRVGAVVGTDLPLQSAVRFQFLQHAYYSPSTQ